MMENDRVQFYSKHCGKKVGDVQVICSTGKGFDYYVCPDKKKSLVPFLLCMTLHISMNLHGPTPHTSLLDIPMPLNTKYNYL